MTCKPSRPAPAMAVRGSMAGLVMAVALAIFPDMASANSSTGFQGTSGIELSSTTAVRMLSEELHIGLDEIRVSYRFRNVGRQPVETMVVFPLPDLDLSLGVTEPAWAFPRRDHDFLGFKVWIDGRPHAATLERRAFFRGRDVTGELDAAGALDLVPWKSDGYDEQVKGLAPGVLERLRSAGLIATGEDENTPQWQLRNRYFWHQTFPPGRDVLVRHAYRPFVGSALLGKIATIDGRTVLGRRVGLASAGTDDRYCLDASTRRHLQEVAARDPREAMPFHAAEIEYILTTARNWAGPIDHFRLVIDKVAPDNLVSLCWKGLRKTGSTRFESTIRGFVPDREIRLLFFVRARPTGAR